MTTTAPNPAKRSRWLDWKPKARILADSAQSEPTKPSKPGSKPGSVGFVGATPGNSLKIERVLDSIRGEPASFLTWAAWKAVALNRLFEEQGATGKPGRITAATVGHGEGSVRLRNAENPGAVPIRELFRYSSVSTGPRNTDRRFIGVEIEDIVR